MDNEVLNRLLRVENWDRLSEADRWDVKEIAVATVYSEMPNSALRGTANGCGPPWLELTTLLPPPPFPNSS